MDLIGFMQDSWKSLKNDKDWLKSSIIEKGHEIPEHYEDCFGKAESLEAVIKGYPYAPIATKTKKEFKQQCAQIIIENLDDLNALLGTRYSASREEVYGFLKVGLPERIIGERNDPHWPSTILFEPRNGASYNSRTGNISFQNKKNIFAVPVERADSVPHEMCHKILEDVCSTASSIPQIDEGICIYSQNTINGKYAAKVDLDTAITCFNCLDYGISMADEEIRMNTITREFEYFRPFPNIKESGTEKRNAHGMGYAIVLYAANKHGEGIIRELVGDEQKA